MADYYRILSGAIESQSLSSEAERQKLYARAKTALDAQFANMDQTLVGDLIKSHTQNFESAIARIEQEIEAATPSPDMQTMAAAQAPAENASATSAPVDPAGLGDLRPSTPPPGTASISQPRVQQAPSQPAARPPDPLERRARAPSLEAPILPVSTEGPGPQRKRRGLGTTIVAVIFILVAGGSAIGLWQRDMVAQYSDQLGQVTGLWTHSQEPAVPSAVPERNSGAEPESGAPATPPPAEEPSVSPRDVVESAPPSVAAAPEHIPTPQQTNIMANNDQVGDSAPVSGAPVPVVPVSSVPVSAVPPPKPVQEPEQEPAQEVASRDPVSPTPPNTGAESAAATSEDPSPPVADTESSGKTSQPPDAARHVAESVPAPATELVSEPAADSPTQVAGDAAATEAANPAPGQQQANPIELPLRAFLLLERGNGGSTADERYNGGARWSFDETSDTLLIETFFPTRGAELNIKIAKNSDTSLPATHTVTYQHKSLVEAPDGPIINFPAMMIREDAGSQGEQLKGAGALIVPDQYLLGLSDKPEDAARNMALLKNGKWIVVPVIFEKQNRRALFVIEKGPAGERAFKAALTAWSAADLSGGSQ